MYALKDLQATFHGFDRWGYIGLKRLQIEYRRAFIGSLWIVLGFAGTSLGIGYLLATLLNVPPSIHVPYVAFGLAIWNFISNAVTAGCGVFVVNRALLLQSPAPRGGFVLAMLSRMFALLVSNLLTAAGIAAAFGWRPTIAAIEAVPALLILLTTAYGVIMLLGLVCTRLPDLDELIASIMRLAFFLTPVIWTLDRRRLQLDTSENLGFLALVYTYNPFSYFLDLMRSPLLGEEQYLINWWVSGALCAGLLITAFFALQFFGKRVAFWV